jgi:uncharacterized delta-60 repeat protein
MKKFNLVRAFTLVALFLAQLSTLCFQSRGAAGDVDLSFDPGSGVNGTVNAVAVQPDGKVIIAGEFTTVRGLFRTNIARLNADGSGDSSFVPVPQYYQQPSYTDTYPVYSLFLQPDGKLLVGSEFHNDGLTRLNSDGSPDTNFNVNALAAISSFTGFLQPAPVYSIVVQVDGKIIYAANGIVLRLNSDGTLDNNFATIESVYVYRMASQSDGKVIISGYFLNTDTGPGYRLARLNTNGSFDSGFVWVTNSPSGSVVLQQDGKVLVSSVYFGAVYYPFARLNPNGTLDATNNVTGGEVNFMARAPNGKVLISGTTLLRLNSDGTVDAGFQQGPRGVRAIAFQTDGRMIIGGGFNIANGKRVARLSASGSVDGNFDPGEGIDRPVSSMAVQADGKILLGLGTPYAFVNGTNVVASLRLNIDGSLDRTFVSANFNPDFPHFPGFEEYWTRDFFAVQSDGKVFVGGGAAHYECDDVAGCVITSTLAFVYRVHANGSLDNTFDPITNGVVGVAVQPDGKVLFGGGGFSIQGTNCSGIARLNTNGTLDTSFNAGALTNFDLMTLQPDGKVLIADPFTNVNGASRNGMARLNSSGSLDSSFNPGIPTNSYVWKMAVQPDGKVLIVVASVNALTTRRVLRLNSDGSIDSTFNLGTLDSGITTNASVFAIATQLDGNVLIGGDFLAVDGIRRTYVARLYGDSFAVAPSLNIVRSNNFVIVSWPASATGYSLQESTNVSDTDSWVSAAQSTITNAGKVFVTIPSNVGNRFFRLKSQ